LFGREVDDPAGGETLWRHQAGDGVGLVVPVNPVPEHELGGIAVESGGRFGGDGIFRRVAGGAGQDHIDAFRETEGGLRRILRRIDGIGEECD
jgi:hypothetical protein